MTEKEKIRVFELANRFLDSLNYKEEMTSIYDSIEKYNLCYSIGWCEKKELHLDPRKRNVYTGAGRILVSRVNELVCYEGSAPFVDWIHQFELEIQNLEEYFVLEIIYSKSNIGSLKVLLNLNTPELLNKVNSDSRIVIEDEDFVLKKLRISLHYSGIFSEILLKQRVKNENK